MNDTFSLQRFPLLLKKTITERPIQNIGVTLLLLILSLILYVAAKEFAGFGVAQNMTFAWGLAGGGFFLASFSFGYFNSNACGSSYLTLPASFLEKWVCAMIIVGIVYPVIFLIVYHLIDMVFVAAYHNSLDPTSPFYKQQYDSVSQFSLNGIIAWKVYTMFLLLTGAMLTGGLYFNKTAFIKTGIIFCLLFIVLFGLNWLLGILFFGSIKEAGIYDHVTLAVGKEEGILLLPSRVESFFQVGISYGLPAILWLVPLIRLREKEF